MSSDTRGAEGAVARLRPILVALLAASLVVAGLLMPTSAPSAQAADLSQFNPGNIISDGVFFNKDSMTQAQVQSFLEAHEKGCLSGATCVKSYRTATRSITKNAMCNAYTGASSETAAAIVVKVARACGINPQVFLVMLQKEQGLIKSTNPSAWAYAHAMGAGCPDSTGCTSATAGFFTQVYTAGWQLKAYGNPPGTGDYFSWFPVGQYSYILYNPNSKCGSEKVLIKNQATADLYYYTPYVPNAAALRAGYGVGDSCSSYGNRNFYNYFTDWFGSTQIQSFITTPTPKVTGTAAPGQILTAQAGNWSPAPSKLAYQWLRSGVAVAGATASTYRVTDTDAGATLSVKVTASRLYYKTVAKTSTATAAVTGIPTTRLAGAGIHLRTNAASQLAHPGPVSTVYIAGITSQEDALSVAALTAATGAGFLVLPVNSMPGSVAAELKRLNPASVVLVGSTSTLDSGTTARVKAVLPKAAVSRIDGADRFARSLSVAARFTSAPTAYLATGWAYPDATGAAAVAGAQKAPLIVIDGKATTASAALLSRLKSLHTTTVVVAGGTSVVSAGIAAALTKVGLTVVRTSGPSLYDTNAALMSAAYPATAAQMITTSTSSYGDAATAAALAGAKQAPLLLTSSTCIQAPMAGFLLAHGAKGVTLAGGTDTLNADVARLLRC